MLVKFADISAIAWYAMQHYMNIHDAWYARRNSDPTVTIAYFAGQYADLNIRLLEEGPERDGLGGALWKVYIQTYGRPPKNVDNFLAFFSSGRYYFWTDNWPMLSQVLAKVIERGSEDSGNGPRRKKD